MTKREWLHSLTLEEAAFRIFGKGFFARRCDECVFYKLMEDGNYACSHHEFPIECHREFDEWLDEEME